MAILNQTISYKLSRAFVTALLASIFTLAFILSPYWLLPGSRVVQVAILAGTLAIGAAWVWLSGQELRISIRLNSLVFFAILLVLMLLLNSRTLISDIPWRGDESYHFGIVVFLMHLITAKYVIGGLLIWCIFLFLVWRKSALAVPAGLLILLCSILTYLFRNPFKSVGAASLLRYPYVNYWFYGIAPKIASLFSNPYQEYLYRLIPFLFAVAIVWQCQEHLRPANWVLRILWGFAVAVMPLIFYYSSILYVELPAVFLMCLVCFRLENLLNADSNEIKTDPGWYALILIGFIKETTIVFLLCFLFWRWAGIGWRWVTANWQAKPAVPFWLRLLTFLKSRVPGEAAIGFSALAPLCLYLVFRTSLAQVRSMHMQPNNFINPATYLTIGRSWVDQFGIFLLLFFLGCILLFASKKYQLGGFFLLAFVAFPLFFAFDSFLWIGYSRFNLFSLPPLLVVTSILINELARQKLWLRAGVAVVTIAACLFMSPINLDGTKAPMWGNYNDDVSEHYYSYQEALTWIKANRPDQQMMFSGMWFSYYFDFYMHKLNWNPRYQDIESPTNQNNINLEKAIEAADKRGDQLILFHILGNQIPLLPDTSLYRQVKVFSNQAHILVIYQRVKP